MVIQVNLPLTHALKYAILPPILYIQMVTYPLTKIVDPCHANVMYVLKLEPSRYTYILPPILYPNGRHYLKFGAHDLSRELRTKASLSLNHAKVQNIFNQKVYDTFRI